MEQDVAQIILAKLEKLEQGQAKLDKLEQNMASVNAKLKKLDKLAQDMQDMQQDMKFVKGVVIRIENDHGLKLNALFDGYAANQELIERHEPRITALEDTVGKLTVDVNVLRAKRRAS